MCMFKRDEMDGFMHFPRTDRGTNVEVVAWLKAGTNQRVRKECHGRGSAESRLRTFVDQLG